MKHLSKKTRAAALITATLLALALLFTGCPNSAGGSGDGTTPPTGKTYTVGGVKFTMKGIATVTNGTVGHTDNASNNAPHTVSLTAYRIGETEVTQELWEKVMGTNPSFFNGTTGNEPATGETQEKRPVEKVNWFECIAFCNELTKKVPELGESQCVYTTFGGHTYGKADAAVKKQPVMNMSKKGFRLPTEAEWEWAAKGGTEDKWAGTNNEDELKKYAWYRNNSGGDANNKTHEVKQKLPNGYGLYDMSGNVSEWCWDWWSSDNTPAGGQTDPEGVGFGTFRISRGGNWSYYGTGSAARAHRDSGDPEYDNDFLGLRVVSRP